VKLYNILEYISVEGSKWCVRERYGRFVWFSLGHGAESGIDRDSPWVNEETFKSMFNNPIKITKLYKKLYGEINCL
jgi:hypothetical protein